MAFGPRRFIINVSVKKIKEATLVDDLAKLKHLIEHWAEHNDEHAESYLTWAEKAAGMGRPELEAALRELAGETRRLKALFALALKECS